jgi:hypothetical protein
MHFEVTDEERLGGLQEQLRRAQVVDVELMSDIAAALVAPHRTAGAERINRLIQIEAWTEAALALVELAHPPWKPRRLVYEDRAWRCSLSNQWSVPDWLDDAAESSHELLPIAILGALIEAKRRGRVLAPRATGSVPSCPIDAPGPVDLMCCDNFA